MTAPEHAPTAPTRAALVRRIVIVAIPLAWLGPFTMDAYSPAFPLIGKDFGVADWAVQLTLTSCLVGLVVGQFASAALSDRFGRRGPLIGSLAVFLLATLACALAPNITLLIVARLLQGASASVGMSTSRTLGRDVLDRRRLAPFFSQLAAVTSIAPVIGPLVGSGLMSAGGSWRWVFAMIGTLGLILLVVVALVLPETHPDRIDPALVPRDRDADATEDGPRQPLRVILRQRAVLAAALGLGFSSGALLSYLAGTSILLQDRYGLTPTQYAVVFALNAVGLLVASQTNARLVRVFRPGAVATVAAGVLAADGIALMVAFASGMPLGVVLGLLAVVVITAGFLGSNLTAVGMSVDRRSASTVSAAIGVAQFGFGALSAPLVGLGAGNAVPSQALLVAVYGTATLLTLVLVGGVSLRSRLAPSGKRFAQAEAQASVKAQASADQVPGEPAPGEPAPAEPVPAEPTVTV